MRAAWDLISSRISNESRGSDGALFLLSLNAEQDDPRYGQFSNIFFFSFALGEDGGE
jgi:hypothetical protein